MRYLKRLGICVAAVCALGAVLVASASAAAPEYGRCEKVTAKPANGGFTNSSCTKKSETKTGKYEWHSGVVKVKQTSVGGKGILEEVGKNAVGCASETSSGEYSGTKNVKNLIVKFKKCESGPFVCTSPGHELGELETKALEGRVVWENEKTKKTALDLFPQGGGVFIEFKCGETLTVSVRGSILVPVKSDKMSLTVPLKYKSKHGFQQVERYEENGESIKDVLESNFANKGFDQAGQTITSTVTNEEKLELNAVI